MPDDHSIPDELLANVARSLDAPAELLPVFPDLFAGVPNLGSLPRRTATLLRKAGLKIGSRVIELAAGKGGLAILLADRFQCNVTAVEGYEPFVMEAATRGVRLGIARRLTWIYDDVYEHVREQTRRFDAAIMLGLDPLDKAGPLLRRLLCKGGLYVIDDCFYDPSRGKAPPWFGRTLTRTQWESMIRSWGDEPVTVDVPAPAAIKRLNASLYRRLESNAKAIGRRDRTLRPALRDFLSRQRHASRILSGPIRPAIWVIRRGS